MSACETDSAVVYLFEDPSNYSKLADTGYSKNPRSLTLDDRSEIADILIDFFCTLKVKACMDQFLAGVKAVGLESFMHSHPEVTKPLFTFTPFTLTSGKFSSCSVHCYIH